MKRILVIVVLSTVAALLWPGTAMAKTVSGRVTSYNATSVSVLDREIVTFTLDENTAYTKLITQKPWQEAARLDFGALGVGRLVAVHAPSDRPFVAGWVQVATDVRPMTSATNAFAVAAQATGTGSTSTGSKTDLLTAKQLKDLIATAKTPADHVRLQKHYLAAAAKYDADAAEHTAEAQAYRKNPTFMESKNPVAPGTVAHCERLAALALEQAKEARDMATAHEHMADAAK